MAGFRDAKGRFISGNPYQFTSGDLGNHWVWLPGSNSKLWDKLVVSMSQKSKLGVATSELNIDPSHINNKALAALLAFDKVKTQIHTRNAMEEVGEYIAENVNERYFQEEGIGGNPWKQLENSTIEWRRRRSYEDGPILRASWEMYGFATSSLAIQEIRGGLNPKVVLGGDNWGTPNAAKYYVHMYGGTGWYGSTIEPRPFMPRKDDDLNRNEKEDIKDIFKKHLNYLFAS